MAKRSKQPPMVDYTTKMMLLEAVRCRNDNDIEGFKWIKRQFLKIAKIYEELNKRGPRKPRK